MDAQQIFNKILTQAIQGNLVEHIDSEGTADDLIREIENEKKRLIDEWNKDNPTKTPKKYVAPKPIIEKDLPKGFNLPKNWKWVRVEDVCAKFMTGPFGSMVHKSDYVLNDGIPLVNPANIVNGKICNDKMMFVDNEKAKELSKYKLCLDDIIIARRGDLTKCALVKGNNVNWLCGTGSFVMHLHIVSPLYFRFLYLSDFVQEFLKEKSSGTTMDNLNQGVFGNLLIPLPPLAEQKRIVAKLDEIKKDIDSYIRLKANISKNCDYLKSAVIQKAIEGKLVEHIEEEGTADDLIRQIEEEKKCQIEKWNKENPTKTQKKYVAPLPIQEDDLPKNMEIPNTWKWVRLGDIGEFIRGKGFVKSDFVDNGYPCIHYGQIHMKFSYKTNKELTYITDSIANKCTIANPGNVIIAITSENEACSCKSTVWDGAYDVAVGAHTAILQHFINPMYVVYFMNSVCFYNQKIKYIRNGKVVEIKPSEIASCFIPLPPLDEQKRIVEKLEEVLNGIERLKK